MHTKTKFTIGARLAIGFSAVFLLMIVLTVLAASRVGRIESVLSQINDVNNVKQRYAINFRGSVHDRAIALRDVVLAGDVAAAQATPVALIRTLDENYARSAAPLDALFNERKDILAEEKEALAAIKTQELRTEPLIERVIALQAEGQREAAATLLSQQAAPAFVEWLASINRLIDLEERLNKDAAAEARAVAQGFFGWMALLCAVAIGAGSLAAWILSRGLLRQLGGQPDYAASIVAAIAAGDLGVKIATRPDDRSSLLYAMGGMRDSLVRIVAQVRNGTESIASVSTDIASGNRDLSGRTVRQAETLEATAASVEQLTGTVRQNADNARQANALAESASAVAVRGGGRTLGQVAHFGGDDGEAAPLLPCARRFHGGIQGQDVGLECDAVDHADDVDDLLRGSVNRGHGFDHLGHHRAALQRHIRRRLGQRIRLARIVGVLAHGPRQFVHRRRRIL